MTDGARSDQAAAGGLSQLVAAKRRLRAEIAANLAELSVADRDVASRAAVERVLAQPYYNEADQIVVYRALDDEVDPAALVERAIADGKSVFLPGVEVGWTLTFRSWRPGETLEPDAAGILHPAAGAPLEQRSTLSIVPGRAFDPCGGRLGRGRGCYDSALERLAELGPTIGLAFACQVVDRVPCGDRDRPVDGWVTDAQAHDVDARDRDRRVAGS